VAKILRSAIISLQPNQIDSCRDGGIGRRRGLKIPCPEFGGFEMVTSDRNQVIRKLRKNVPELTLEQIGKIFDGLSKQRVHQILQSCDSNVIMSSMDDTIKINIGNKPISATQAAKISKIPYSVIATWVKRGFVQVVSRPEKGVTWGKPVLLDPVSLQERIVRYKPRRKKDKVPA